MEGLFRRRISSLLVFALVQEAKIDSFLIIKLMKETCNWNR